MALELVTTNGVFALDGGEWEVTNNTWLVGDDGEVLVFDAAYDHQPIAAAVGGRRVVAIVCTHGHNDHINAALALREAVDAPVLVHADDRMLWDAVYPDDAPDRHLMPGTALVAGGCELTVVHTPGSCCFYDVVNGRVLSGDTLFCGGPGATGRSYSDEPAILRSIRSRLLSLPADTVVHTGHGDDTTIGAEVERVLDRMVELDLAC